METYDPQMAARVWQRVSSKDEPTDSGPALLAMIAGEWTDAVTYLRLSRKYQGRESALLRRLFEEEQAHTACLKGIYTLLTGQKAVTKPSPAPQESVETTLRRCYGREMRCLAQYEQHSSHREYGPVFARMADQEREHCRILLELLGKRR